MNIRTTLFTVLKAGVPSVANKVYGGQKAAKNAGTRYLVFFIISRIPDHTHDGQSGLYSYRVQVSCYGKTYQQAGETAEEVQNALSGCEGTDDVQATFSENEQDFYDEDTGLYFIPVDFIIQTNTN